MANFMIPFDQREGFIWLDGELIAWRDALVHFLSHGLHYASCVFEGERAYGGKIFKSREHAERLHNSARIMGFTIPYSVASLVAAKDSLLQANKLGDAYLRLVAFRGSEEMGIAARNSFIHVAIAAWAWENGQSQRHQEFSLDIAEYRRPDPRTAPVLAKASGLYEICSLILNRSESKGYDNALMFDWLGRIAEITTANIFFVHHGKIHTPIADCFLNGITRQTVISLAQKRGIEVVDRRIWPSELTTFDEIFITGSAAEVKPVTRIEDMTIKSGMITQALIDDYQHEVRHHQF